MVRKLIYQVKDGKIETKPSRQDDDDDDDDEDDRGGRLGRAPATPRFSLLPHLLRMTYLGCIGHPIPRGGGLAHPVLVGGGGDGPWVSRPGPHTLRPRCPPSRGRRASTAGAM